MTKPNTWTGYGSLVAATVAVSCVTLCPQPSAAGPGWTAAGGSASAVRRVRQQPLRSSQRPNDGLSQRERLAMSYMESRLKHHFPPSQYTIEVRPRLVQYPGNHRRPVTAQRPVEVQARVTLKEGQGGFIKRAVQRIRGHVCYYVDSRPNASPAVVAQESMHPIAVVARKIGFHERLHDILHSKGVRRGAITCLAGAAVSSVSGPAGIATVAYAGKDLFAGVSRRIKARKDAVRKTVDWARRSIEQGVTPASAEAFATYKDILRSPADGKPGTHPGSMSTFLDRLASYGL